MAADISVNVHIRGPVQARVSRNSSGPYVVFKLGGEDYTGANLFPDREALDSLIDQATMARDRIDRELGVNR